MKIIVLLTAIGTGIGLASCEKAPDTADYPLTSCVVSGENLDSMGEPFIFDYEGTDVRLCCKSCREDFDKDPQTYMAKLKP